jgi:hypothetical protein
MKKIFIGCGIVVLLLLGCIAVLAWQLWPDFKDFRHKNDDAVARLNALVVSAPFDPAGLASLDTARFARALDLRAQICEDLKGVNDRLGKLYAPEAKPGPFESMKTTFRELGSMMPRYADRLEAAHMSWPEFAWHTRLFWAVLQRASIHAGVAQLEHLGGDYARLETIYDKQREKTDLPPLKDLIGEFPPAIIAQASEVMVTDVDRVQSSLGMLEGERIFMLPASDAALFGFDKLPDATEDRIEAQKQASQPPAEPAHAPK